MYERAVNILAAVDEAQLAAQRVHDAPQGTLRISCGVEFGMMAVTRWINGYLQRHPQLSVEADYTNRLVDIVHEGFDIAIRVGELPDSSLVARKLGNMRYGLYASPAYLQRAGAPATPQSLAQHALLVFNMGRQKEHWDLQRDTEHVQVPLQSRLRINSSFAVCDAAVLGHGIARLPLLVAQNAVAEGRLTPVLAQWQPRSAPVHALFPSVRYLTPKVRGFIDYAAERFEVV
jgi:LysR family transcriptional regulator, regulator for bpeEF and oprC